MVSDISEMLIAAAENNPEGIIIVDNEDKVIFITRLVRKLDIFQQTRY